MWRALAAGAALGLLGWPVTAPAQIEFLSEDPGVAVAVEVAARVEPGTLAPGGQGRLVLEVRVEPSWYIYSLEARNGPPSRLLLDTSPPVRPAGAPAESEPTLELDVEAGTAYRYHEGQATFRQPLTAAPEAAPGRYTLTGRLAYSACNGEICLPERTAPFRVRLAIDSGAAGR